MKKLIKKMKESEDKWLLPVPLFSDGKMYIRMYMRDKKYPVGTFQSVYTYRTNFEIVCDFFSELSFGQAYNKWYKNTGTRCDFAEHKSKETGWWTTKDVEYEFGTSIIMRNVRKVMRHRGTEFNEDRMQVFEHKTLVELKMEAKKQKETSARDKAIAEARAIPLGMDY